MASSRVTTSVPLTQLQTAYLQGRSSEIPLGGVSTAGHHDFECALDPQALGHAIDEVVARHPMLRMVASPNDGVQRPVETTPYTVEVVDWSRLDDDYAAQRLDQFRDDRVSEVMDVTTWPCFRFTVVRLPGDRQILAVDFDLFFLDGPSIFAVLKEINDVVNGHELTERPNDEPTFADLCMNIAARHARHLDVDRAFWTSQFSSVPQAPHLPVAVPTSGRPTGIFRRVRTVLDSPRWERLRTAASARSLPPLAVVIESYVEALRRWSGTAEFTVNFTTADRPSRHHPGGMVLGEYTSTMPFPVRAADDDFWLDASNNWTHLGRCLAHSGFSTLDLARELRDRTGETISGGLPIVFTAMMADSRGFNDGSESLGQIVWSCSSTPQVLVDFQLLESHRGVALSVDYREPYITHRIAQGILDDVVAMLEAIIDGEDPVSAVRLPKGDQTVWTTVNSTGGRQGTRLLHEAALQAMVARPDHAIVCDNEGWHTNRELLDHARLVHQQLVAMGVGVGDYVAVDGYRRASTIAAMLGVLQTGAAYIPLDPGQPPARHRQILDTSRARARITPEGTIELHKESPRKRDTVTLDSPAYAIFTSGTTGTPKGVVISHRSVMNTIEDVIETHSIGPSDRIAGVSSFSFDLSVFDIHGALISQAQLFLYEDQRDIPTLANGLVKDGITVWNTVPAIMGLVVEELERTGAGLLRPYWKATGSQAFSVPWDLRLVMLSGDWIPVDLPDRISRLATGAHVLSLGGATEGAIWSIWFDVAEVSPTWRSVPYGHAMRNQTMWITDHHQRVSPVGCIGEICIGGQGVALGYLNAPEQTDQAFVSTPELGRVYRTGDFGRMGQDGEIEFLGRRDSQVKVNGHRIELAEIESATIRELDVIHVAAAVKQVPPDSKSVLCLYYVSDQEFTPSDVRDTLRARLPQYMLPSHVMRVDCIPMSSNGKVNTALLPVPQPRHHTASTTQKWTPQQRLIQRVWLDVLDLDDLGLSDDVFEAGADSLSVIQFHATLRAAGLTVSVYDVFENPTVQSLATVVGQQVPETASCRPAAKPISGRLYDPADHARAWGGLALLRQPDPQRILITGATGFLGGYLMIQEMPQDTELWCLVRGGSQDEAEKRLWEILRARFGDEVTDTLTDRVHVVVGDMERANLGLDEAQLDSCMNVDTIIHAAADVSHFAAPGTIDARNLRAVENVIDLARHASARLFHVSTSQVMGVPPEESGIYGELCRDVGQSFLDQYSHSKFESEKQCFEAFDSGLHGAVLRLGNLCFDSRTGAMAQTGLANTYAALINVIARFGSIPDNLAEITDLSYVDTAAHAVSALVHAPMLPDSHSFHIMNPHRPSMETLHALVSAPCRQVPSSAFRSLLESHFTEHPDDVAVRNCLLNAHVWQDRYGAQFSARETNSLLADLGVHWPEPASLLAQA